FFCVLVRRTQRSTLFPYTTLFRSEGRNGNRRQGRDGRQRRKIRRLRRGRARDGSEYRDDDERAHVQSPHERAKQVFRQPAGGARSEEHTSELQSRFDLVCRLLLEK